MSIKSLMDRCSPVCLSKRSRQRPGVLLAFLSFIVLIYWLFSSLITSSLPFKPHNNRLFCIVLTCPKNLQVRVEAAYDAWAHECDMVKFITVLPEHYSSDNVSVINSRGVAKEARFKNRITLRQPANFFQENYNKLTDKVYLTMIDIYRSFGHDYDWFLKCDDDTFIFVDHLKEFLADHDPRRSIYLGYELNTWVSGGAGYVVSQAALKSLARKLTFDNGDKTSRLLFNRHCENTGIEDQDVTACLDKVGAKRVRSVDELGRERFHTYDPYTHLMKRLPDWLYKFSVNKVKTGPDCCSNTTISFHYIKPDQMRQMGFWWNKYRQRRDNFNSSLRLEFHHVLFKMACLEIKLDL